MVGRENGLTINWQRVAFQIDDINVLFIIIFSNEFPSAINDQAKPFTWIQMPENAIILVILGPPRKIRREVILIINPVRDSIGLWGQTAVIDNLP